MQITGEFLKAEIAKMAKLSATMLTDVAVASQAAIDVMKALLLRLDMPETEGVENGSV
jgi:hypothetical protein